MKEVIVQRRAIRANRSREIREPGCRGKTSGYANVGGNPGAIVHLHSVVSHPVQFGITALEDLDYLRIEALPRLRGNLPHGLVQLNRAPVRTVRRERVKAIDSGKNSCTDRDLLAR